MNSAVGAYEAIKQILEYQSPGMKYTKQYWK